MKKMIRNNYVFFTLVLIFGFNFGFSQGVSWPVSPGNLQKNITGTLGEFRDDDPDARFHRGNDIIGDNYNVYAISSGTVTITNTGNCWTTYLIIDNVRYFHIEPAAGLISGVTHINDGDLIGTMFSTGGCNYHVHLHRPGTNYLNAMINPFIDNTFPTIHGHSFWINGYQYRCQTTELDDLISINTINHPQCHSRQNSIVCQ